MDEDRIKKFLHNAPEEQAAELEKYIKGKITTMRI